VPLRVAILSLLPSGPGSRPLRFARALEGRGDAVTVLGPSGELPALAEVLRAELAAARGCAGGRFDAVLVHGDLAPALLAAAPCRAARVPVLVDARDGGTALAPRARLRALGALADALLAESQDHYERLLRAGLPARQVGIVVASPDPEVFAPRAAEPPLRPGVAVHVVIPASRPGPALDAAVAAFAEARAADPRLLLVAPAAARSDPLDALPAGAFERHDDPARALAQAHVALVTDDRAALPAGLLESLAVGVPTVAALAPGVAREVGPGEVVEVRAGDQAGIRAALGALARDGRRRKTLAAAGLAWTAAHGWAAQRGFLFRTLDALCAEEAEAARRARQAAVDGVKTGTRRESGPRGPGSPPGSPPR
jgi:glycosyltransferase involved in cell wall biosynthesis